MNQPLIVAENLGVVSVPPGTLRAVDVFATDPEGGMLEFFKVEGPAYATVLTINRDPAPGVGRASSHARGFGLWVTVGVSDGTKTSHARLFVDVPDEVSAPPF